MENNQKLTDELKLEIQTATSAVGEFRKSFSVDAFRALGNCDDVFRHAARLEVAKQVLEAVEQKGSQVTINSLLQYSRRLLDSKICWPNNSTSATSNLLKSYEGAAWGWMCEILLGYA